MISMPFVMNGMTKHTSMKTRHYGYYKCYYSESIRENTEKMGVDFDEEKARLRNEINLFKKETASVVEEFNKLSFMYKGLKRGMQ